MYYNIFETERAVEKRNDFRGKSRYKHIFGKTILRLLKRYFIVKKYILSKKGALVIVKNMRLENVTCLQVQPLSKCS